MRLLIVGAGAVGAVLGTLLERAGHDVVYWARGESPAHPQHFELVRGSGQSIASQPLRWHGSAGEAGFDHVLVCVRSSQLSAALQQLATLLGPELNLVIATIALDRPHELARSAGLRGRALACHVSFGARLDSQTPARVHWFPFTPPTLISADGRSEDMPAARALARALRRAGLRTLAVRSSPSLLRAFAVATSVLLPAWGLCGWEPDRLARDSGLRTLTASAMREAVRTFAPAHSVARALSRGLPRAFYALLLLVLPWLMNGRTRALWRAHGPKIDDQTQYALAELLERSPAPLTHVSALYARWLRAAAAHTPDPRY